MPLRAGLITPLLCVALLAGCPREPSAQGPRLTLTPCRPRGVSEEMRCGTLQAPEDRATGKGRTLSLNIQVMPALAPSPAPDPVFFLAGGPGQAATDPNGFPLVKKLHRTRDIVFVDQRGTGKSSPLACSESKDAGFEERFGPPDVSLFRRCLADYRDAGMDPSRFTTSNAMDDLDDVRAALGYDRINLFGVSYGTRAALVYLRRHPERVRTLVLDGVNPPSVSLVLSPPQDVQRAFGLVFAACAQDPACAKAYPALEERFGALLERLEKEPLKASVAHPVTGALMHFTVTRTAFISNLYVILYSPEVSALLPLIIDRATRGDLSPFVAQAQLLDGVGEGVSRGMFFSVVCAEDAPVATPARLAESTKGTYFQEDHARPMLDVCAFWPRGEVPEGFHQPVASATPVLLLSGELDPVTPPARAEEARVQLSRSVAVVVPGTGHNTSLSGCVPRLITQFVDQGNGDGLPVDCVKGLSRPPFFVTFAGPSP